MKRSEATAGTAVEVPVTSYIAGTIVRVHEDCTSVVVALETGRLIVTSIRSLTPIAKKEKTQ
jgi:hypothetical protein